MKKILALIICAICLLPSLAFAGGYFISQDKYLDLKKINILSTYKDKTFTQYINIGFQTDSPKFAVIIPVEQNAEFGIEKEFNFQSYLKDIGQLTRFNLNSFSIYDNYPVAPNIVENIDFTKASSAEQVYELLKDNKLAISNVFKKSLEKYQQTGLDFITAVVDLKDVKTSSKLNYWSGETETIKLSYKTNRPVIYDALYNDSVVNSDIKPAYNYISISDHKTSITDFTPVFGDFVSKKQSKNLSAYLNDKSYITVLINKLAEGQVAKDWVLTFSENDSPINSNISGFFESTAWYFLFFAIAIVLIIISPFGVLFYYSSYVQKKIIQTDFKRLYRFFQFFSYFGILAISIILIIILSKTEPFLFDNLLYYTGIRAKFSYVYYGAIFGIVIVNVVNILIITLYNKKQIKKTIKKLDAKEKINKMFDIH